MGFFGAIDSIGSALGKVFSPSRPATAPLTAATVPTGTGKLPPLPRDGSIPVRSGSSRLALDDDLKATAPLKASDVKTTADYSRFIGRLEKEYPAASGFDINRAVRQHFYSDDGVKNTEGVFDRWLGRDGGKNRLALEGVEKDLEGLPTHITDHNGKRVDLSHMAVGIDAYYNQKTDRHGLLQAPADAFKGVMLTHGGDLGQVFASSVLAAGNAVGLSDSGDTFSKAVNFASADQLRGNQDGLSMGLGMGRNDMLSATLDEHYR